MTPTGCTSILSSSPMPNSPGSTRGGSASLRSAVGAPRSSAVSASYRPATGTAVIDIPKRRHQNVRYLDERTRLRDYPEPIRQVAVTRLGREDPTLFFSHKDHVTAPHVIPPLTRPNRLRESLRVRFNTFHPAPPQTKIRPHANL